MIFDVGDVKTMGFYLFISYVHNAIRSKYF